MEINELILRYPQLEKCRDDIEKVVEIFVNCYKKGGKILLCGNGGSESDCDHIVGELMKGFLSHRKLNKEDSDKINEIFEDENAANNLQYAIPAISLPSLTAVSTAFINDVSPDMVYAQLMYGYAKENDVAVGISTSGNSKNVVCAIKCAKAKNIVTVALTGKKESRLSDICDVTIKVPESETYKIQELHLPVYHYICAKVEEVLFGEKKSAHL